MVKRFVTKKYSTSRIKYIFKLVFIILLFNIVSYLFLGNIKMSNEFILKSLLASSNHHIINSSKNIGFASNVVSLFTNNNINDPTSFLEVGLIDIVDISNANDGIITTFSYTDSYEELKELEKVTEYIPDPNPIIPSKPRVYIYNTHQLETYKIGHMETYNIRPNVMVASYILRENLNKLGLSTIVDETNLTEFLRVNNWTYADSYKASRLPLLDAIENYDTLEYFIDIHRDSVRKKVTAINIKDKTYARTLFVVGLDHDKYQDNLKLARELHSLIEKKYPGLSRGVLTKKGKGVNGIYNQDVSKKSMLIEIGGVDNTIDEVLNTTEVIAEIIYKYIEGD